MQTHVTLSDVPGAQHLTRRRSLINMTKEQLIARVLEVEDHARRLDAQLHVSLRAERATRQARVDGMLDV